MTTTSKPVVDPKALGYLKYVYSKLPKQNGKFTNIKLQHFLRWRLNREATVKNYNKRTKAINEDEKRVKKGHPKYAENNRPFKMFRAHHGKDAFWVLTFVIDAYVYDKLRKEGKPASSLDGHRGFKSVSSWYAKNKVAPLMDSAKNGRDISNKIWQIEKHVNIWKYWHCTGR